MVTQYARVALGSQATQYIRECLAQGKTLSKHILQLQDLEDGKVDTFVPDGVPTENVLNFREGIHPFEPPTPPKDGSALWIPKLTMDDLLADEMYDYVRRSKDRLCVLEDELASPRDEYLKLVKTRFLSHGDEVYHLVCHGDDRSRVEETISQASGWLFVGVLSVMPKTLRPKAAALTDQDLAEVARASRSVLVGAYDGEGYLVWTKNEHTSSSVRPSTSP